ncbi:MAG TPA: sensor histidine kinase [Burkholderiales bacterium]|nr:sensor histidine kinase [Burkholderiales bacterium]
MRATRDGVVPSIRRRMLGLLMPALAVVLALNVWTDIRTSTEPTREAYDQALADTAVAVAAHVQYRDGAFFVDLPPQAAMALHTNRFDEIYYVVRDARGQLVAGSPDLPVAPRTLEHSPAYFDAQYLGKRVRVVVYRSATPAGEVTVQVAQTVRRRDQLAARFVTMDILQDLLLVVATLLLVYFGVRFGLAPLMRLREDLEKRTADDLRPVDEAQIPSEVQPLVQALNRLLRLLRVASEAQQRFLANAAHQLRTPLTGLQTQLELAAKEQDPRRLQERLCRLQEAASRLVRLTNQVLALARAEPSASLLQGMRTIDLRNVVETSASTYLDRALAKNIDIGFEAAPALIHGSDWLARELTANLVENALSYTPCGGQVTVRCGTRGREAYLEVEDNGPGIPESERDHVFERFYRLPGSAGEGSGLGLAIVQEIAQVHRARIQMDTPQGGGTRVEVRFAGVQ